MNSGKDQIMFNVCRKSSKFYVKVDEEDEEQSQESGKNSNSLEHLSLIHI